MSVLTICLLAVLALAACLLVGTVAAGLRHYDRDAAEIRRRLGQ